MVAQIVGGGDNEKVIDVDNNVFPATSTHASSDGLGESVKMTRGEGRTKRQPAVEEVSGLGIAGKTPLEARYFIVVTVYRD